MKLQNIKIGEAMISPTNTKGRTEGAGFKELVESIKEKGVLVPVLARPIIGGGKFKFEVVAGNRRLAAAKEAGLLEIPAKVQDMSDVEAREAQIVENLQRADIHPLDEGEAYRKLIEVSGYTLMDVGVKVGKSVTYVRDRLVLTNLVKEAKTAFREGTMSPSHASLIARLDTAQQKEAIEYVTDAYENVSLSDLREWIQDKVMEESKKNPPWKGDAELEATFQGCEECQGKGGDLFGKKAAESCTNPKCYSNRVIAYIAIQKKKNPEMIDLTGNWSNTDDLIGSGSYKEINSKKDACDREEKGIIVQGNGMGRIVRLCRVPECKKHWKDEKPSAHYKPTPEEKAKRKAEKEAALKKVEKADKEMADALAKVKFPMTKKQLDVLVQLVFGRFGYSYMQGVAKRHEIKAVKKTQNGYTSRDLDTPMKKYVAGLDDHGKLRFIFEVALEATGGEEAKKYLKNL